ncbi:hypothetical protein ACQ4PT_035876 [Festuca glaucescens]
MAVYYRYRSGVDTFSLPVAAPSISVGEVKRLIMGTSRHGHGRTRGRGPRECIAISDAQTGEEYTNDRALGPAQLDGGGAPSRRASGRCHRVAIHSTPQSDARRWRFFVGFFLEVEVERVGGRGGRRDQGYQRGDRRCGTQVGGPVSLQSPWRSIPWADAACRLRVPQVPRPGPLHPALPHQWRPEIRLREGDVSDFPCARGTSR